MKYEERQPGPGLQPFVKCIWQLDREYKAGEIGEVLWPDGCQEMIVHFGASYESESGRLPHAFFIGMLSRYHHLHADGRIRLFGVRLLPWGLAAFSAVPAKQLGDRCVPLGELFEASAVAELTEQLSGASMDEAVQVLERFLKSRLDTRNMDLPFVRVLEGLYREPVQRDVNWAVETSGYSQRQFERKTVELVGLTARRLIKIARFNQARLRIMFQPDIDLHACMEEFGYYDYAHFSKDFKLCLGLTPANYQKWARQARHGTPHEDVVFLQD